MGIGVSNHTVMKSGMAESSPKNEWLAKAFITAATNTPASRAAIMPPLPRLEMANEMVEPSSEMVGPAMSRKNATPAMPASLAVFLLRFLVMMSEGTM